MNQQAGASCPSRTPSISLAPPRALPSLPPSSYPPPPPSPVIIHLLPFCPFVVLSPPLIRRADTSQQPTTSYYSKGQGGKKIVSLSFSPPSISRSRTLPFLHQPGNKPRGRFYGQSVLRTSLFLYGARSALPGRHCSAEN